MALCRTATSSSTHTSGEGPPARPLAHAASAVSALAPPAACLLRHAFRGRLRISVRPAQYELLVLSSGRHACMCREQFEIPQPTDSYAEVVQLLPAEWVGGASRLVPLVQVGARGITYPPSSSPDSGRTGWSARHTWTCAPML